MYDFSINAAKILKNNGLCKSFVKIQGNNRLFYVKKTRE